MEKQKLLNTYVNNVNMEETLSAIENMVESGEKKICSCNKCRCCYEN